MRSRTLWLFALVLFGAAIDASAHDGNVTFNNQVVRILQQHCQTCHRPGNIAPFPLLTYRDTLVRASQLRHAVETGEMPPWKPVASHGMFESERTLTDDEKDTLIDWVNLGAPEGLPADLPEPLTFPETWSAGAPNMVVQPPGAFPLTAGTSDIYRCFPIDVNAQSDLYIRGYEVLPGNRAVVHHILLFVDENNASTALDAADPGLGYTCFGGAGFTGGLGGVGGWVPGASPQQFPLGTGVRIPAGARIVMQVHYSTSEVTSSGPLDPDLTRLGLYLSPVPLQPITFLPVVNPFFAIPPGESRYQVKAVTFIGKTVELVSIAPHMHFLGRETWVDAIFPDGSRRRLIHIDDWDFHWQGNYIFKEPVLLPTGTIVEMTAFYDNSSDNPRNPNSPPITVRWGERTVDEMCLTFLAVKDPGTPAMNTVPFSLGDRGSESVITLGANTGGAQVGYARVSSGGASMSGLAIFGYRQNGVLISETGVPASGVLTQGRIYGETSAAVRSGLAISNPNAEQASVSFTFIDDAGREVYSNSTSVPPNGQIAAFLNESPFNGPAAFSGSFSFSSSKPVAVVALRGVVNERSDFILTTLPVVDLGATASAGTAFPYFADGAGWTTSVLLVNPTDAALSGALQFVDPTGKPQSNLNYSIPARSARQFSTSGSGDSVHTGSVSVAPAQGSQAPAGSLVFSYRASGTRLTEAGVSAAAAGKAFRVYVEASDSIQSGIAITNTSSSSATVRLELVNLSGAAISATTFTLGLNSQISSFLKEIPGFQSLSLPVQGLLRITSSANVAVVGLRSRTNERGDFLITTTPPVAETTTPTPELFFPHFADGGGYTTQFILFSAGSSDPASGSIRFLSQAGQAMDLKLK